MNQAIQFEAGFGILLENDFTKDPAVDRAIRCNNSFAELFDNGRVNSLPWFEKLMRDSIRIDQMAAELDEHLTGGALAGRNPAGKPDSKH
jgi:hypothetical protein